MNTQEELNSIKRNKNSISKYLNVINTNIKKVATALSLGIILNTQALGFGMVPSWAVIGEGEPIKQEVIDSQAHYDKIRDFMIALDEKEKTFYDNQKKLIDSDEKIKYNLSKEDTFENKLKFILQNPHIQEGLGLNNNDLYHMRNYYNNSGAGVITPVELGDIDIDAEYELAYNALVKVYERAEIELNLINDQYQEFVNEVNKTSGDDIKDITTNNETTPTSIVNEKCPYDSVDMNFLIETFSDKNQLIPFDSQINVLLSEYPKLFEKETLNNMSFYMDKLSSFNWKKDLFTKAEKSTLTNELNSIRESLYKNITSDLSVYEISDLIVKPQDYNIVNKIAIEQIIKNEKQLLNELNNESIEESSNSLIDWDDLSKSIDKENMSEEDFKRKYDLDDSKVLSDEEASDMFKDR